MANLKDKQSLSPLTLPVVLVGPGLRISDQLNEENRLLAFERAWGLLAPAVEREGEHTKASVLAALCRGKRRLWVSATSALVSEIVTYPSGLVVGNAWLAGGNLKEIASWLPLWEEWSKSHGAVRTRVNGRRGWGRVIGYKEVRAVMMKDLR